MKILSLDVSGNYSSIAMLDGDEVNSFTQTHIVKIGLIGISFLQVLALIQEKISIALMDLPLHVVQVRILPSELLLPF